jgi:protein-disulfide isomerase
MTRHDTRGSWPIALTLALLMLMGAAGAQIGLPHAGFQDALGVDVEAREGEALETASGVRLELETRGDLLFAVRGETVFGDPGSLDPAVADVAAAIALGTGLGAAIETPVVEFLRTRTADLAGRGPSIVGIGRYHLMLDVRGEGVPYAVEFRLALAEVDEGAFPPARHVLGPPDAPIVVREFSDFQCPFCKRYAEQVLPAIKERLLARGDVRFEYHHFPLRSIHANAMRAAEASECAADAAPDDDEAFWRYHDALFAGQAAWSGLADPDDYFVGLADGVGVDPEAVATCLAEDARRDTVERAYGASVDLQLTGTPTVFVGGYRLEDFTDIAAYLETIALVEAFGEPEADAP